MKTLNALPPSIEVIKKSDTSCLVVSGSWLTRYLDSVESRMTLAYLKVDKQQKIHIEFSKDFQSDTAGCWLIAKLFKEFKNHKIAVTTENHPPYIDELVDKNFSITPKPSSSWWINFIQSLGQSVMEMGKNGKELTGFLGEVLVTVYRGFRYFKCLRWTSIIHHLQIVGLQALPIIGLISFLIGAVLAYQGIIQLDRFGASIYTIDFLGIALVRELSVLLTSIVVAGRSGSSFTAQIGTMALNQEIDAIRVLGLNPIIVLVLPRILALFIALPILVVVSMLTGCLGGMVLTSILIDVGAAQFWQSLQKAVTVTTFWVGISKAPLFAIIIGVVSCFRGLQVKGSAESIGLMTTRSVVEGIFLVIICDALMSIVFSTMGI